MTSICDLTNSENFLNHQNQTSLKMYSNDLKIQNFNENSTFNNETALKDYNPFANIDFDQMDLIEEIRKLNFSDKIKLISQDDLLDYDKLLELQLYNDDKNFQSNKKGRSKKKNPQIKSCELLKKIILKNHLANSAYKTHKIHEQHLLIKLNSQIEQHCKKNSPQSIQAKKSMKPESVIKKSKDNFIIAITDKKFICKQPKKIIPQQLQAQYPTQFVTTNESLQINNEQDQQINNSVIIEEGQQNQISGLVKIQQSEIVLETNIVFGNEQLNSINQSNQDTMDTLIESVKNDTTSQAEKVSPPKEVSRSNQKSVAIADNQASVIEPVQQQQQDLASYYSSATIQIGKNHQALIPPLTCDNSIFKNYIRITKSNSVWNFSKIPQNQRNRNLLEKVINEIKDQFGYLITQEQILKIISYCNYDLYVTQKYCLANNNLLLQWLESKAKKKQKQAKRKPKCRFFT